MNIMTTKKRKTVMKRNIIIKVLTIIFILVCICGNIIPAFAAGNAEDKQTEVLFLCKLDESVETDDYSVIVVKLLNEDTLKASTYKLYNYNKFSERYLMDNGVYSIVYAYIQGRNDIIFDVVSEETFDIGFVNSIYFELVDSSIIAHTEKSETTTTEWQGPTSVTKKPEPSTLFPIYTTEDNETSEDLSDTIINNGTTDTGNETTTKNNNENTTTDATESTTHNYTEISTTQETQLTEMSHKLAIVFIAGAIIFLILVVLFIIHYTKKKE